MSGTYLHYTEPTNSGDCNRLIQDHFHDPPIVSLGIKITVPYDNGRSLDRFPLRNHCRGSIQQQQILPSPVNGSHLPEHAANQSAAR